MARIRSARPADAAGIQRVARAAWHAAYDHIIGPDVVEETVDAWYEPERLIEDDIEPPDRPFLVAVEEGTVLAFAEAAPDPDREGIAHLYRIYVVPQRQGEGLGGKLLDRLEHALAQRGFERLHVIVLAENEVGVEFYEAAGFERVGTGHNDRFDEREYEYAKPL